LPKKPIEAVSQWLFDPAVKARKAAVYIDIEVNFQLSQQ